MSERDTLPEIPGYRIEKKLGKGGMADVFLGLQEALGRKVAIKILNRDMINNQQLLQRFVNEARTASRLEHPNIVTIHDVAQQGDNCYIVMEYLQESLVDRIRFSQDLKIQHNEAFFIVKQMARALAYAHREGFIHRDIKPDNILFRKDNTPVLVDFGIARALNSESHLTTVGMIIGTPHYMSPEQCRGEKIDGQSDIYSLGVVLYEMLTGNIPYKADSAAGLLVKHIQEPIPRLPNALKRYQPLLDRMMAKDKSDRIHTAEELIKVMDQLTSGGSALETIEVSKPEEWVFNGRSSAAAEPRTADFQPTMVTPVRVKRKRSSLPLILLLLLILGGGGWLGYQYWYKPMAAAKNNSAEPTDTDATTGQIEVDEPTAALPGTQTPDLKEDRTRAGNQTDSAAPEKKDTPKQAPDKENTSSTVAESAQPLNTADQKFDMLMSMAQEYFRDGQIRKAQDKLDQAKAIKTNDLTKELQQGIYQLVESRRDKEYMAHLNKALTLFDRGRLEEARKSIDLARKIKNTADLSDLETKISRKEQQLKAAARLKLADDEAYNAAVSRNTIISYEKYMKNYPRGRHDAEAGKKLEQLKSAVTLEIRINDDVAFETASSQNTISGYEDYLKKFPYGRHVQDTQTKMAALKSKLARQIKDKIDVQQIRFFQSGPKAQAIEQRTYALRFPQSSTQYIYTEITYRNRLYRIAAGDSRVLINYSGAFQQQLQGTISPYKEAETGTYWRGMGWTDAGKWPVGTFTVTVSIEGKQVGKASFEIY